MIKSWIGVIAAIGILLTTNAYAVDPQPGDIIKPKDGQICDCVRNQCSPDGCLIPISDDGREGCCPKEPESIGAPDASKDVKDKFAKKGLRPSKIIYWRRGLYVGCSPTRDKKKGQSGCRVLGTLKAR